jgi:hypothetical protein
MKLPAKLDPLYEECRGNRWLRYFAVFCRAALALGFVPSGLVKVMGSGEPVGAAAVCGSSRCGQLPDVVHSKIRSVVSRSASFLDRFRFRKQPRGITPW